MNVNVIFAGNPAKIVKRKEDYELDENNDKAIDIDPILQCKDMKIAAAVEMIIHTRYSSCIGKTEMYANGAAEYLFRTIPVQHSGDTRLLFSE